VLCNIKFARSSLVDPTPSPCFCYVFFKPLVFFFSCWTLFLVKNIHVLISVLETIRKGFLLTLMLRDLASNRIRLPNRLNVAYCLLFSMSCCKVKCMRGQVTWKVLYDRTDILKHSCVRLSRFANWPRNYPGFFILYTVIFFIFKAVSLSHTRLSKNNSFTVVQKPSTLTI